MTLNNDPEGKHEECRYFVLDPQHDPIARRMLFDYARIAGDRGYPVLAEKLRAWVPEADLEDVRG